MSNLELLCAGFSAILGTEVVPQNAEGRSFSVHDLFNQTYVMRPSLETLSDVKFTINIAGLTGRPERIEVTAKFTIEEVKAEIERKLDISMDTIRLIFAGKQLKDTHTLGDYGIEPESTVYLALPLLGGGRGGSMAYGLDALELDPGFDYDFTHVKDDGTNFMRGGFPYKRPYGWKRIALKVLGRYSDDKWLGPNGIRTDGAPGEWPVSYHGTNMTNAKLILKDGYKAGPRAKFGRGIYTSPSLEMVDRLYAQEFSYKGKTYKIVLQNRVDPNHLQIISATDTGAGADYWLTPAKNAGCSRPYGILIREVPNN